MANDDLRKSDVMAHLMDSLEQGKDIGHYGRLVFTMTGRFFMDDDEMIRYLTQDKDVLETDARALLLQVQEHDYNPPKREKILAWQEQQDFPICPNPDDPNACNLYNDLQFPDGVYDHISDFYEERAEAEA
jgi:hypothetical protein